GSATLDITVSVNTDDSSQLINIAQVVASDQIDPDSTPDNNNNLEDDQDILSLPLQVADLELTKEVDDTTPEVGQLIKYTITITNKGPDSATNIKVEDILPTGISFVSANPSEGTYDNITGIWSGINLLNSEVATLEINGTVLQIGDYANTAQVIFSDQFDGDSTPANGIESEDDQDSISISPIGAGLPLTVTKFYDSNFNGEFDDGEEILEGWKVTVDSTEYFTTLNLNMNSLQFTVTEQESTLNNWQNTTPKTVEVDLDEVQNVDIEFGNVCVDNGGGNTQGFWSNRNGQNLYNAGLPQTQDALNALNLVSEDGSTFDHTSYNEFRQWLKNTNTAENMAYKLSVQLAAMTLNVQTGEVEGSTYVYAPELEPFAAEVESIIGSEFNGYITVNDLILVADYILANEGDGIIDEQDSNFAFAETAKDVLDNGNNDLAIFASADACEYSFE
ncbi:MAG: DUF11 domain-containing protein, partial [Nitrosopumilus sp.]|nr:DUF11 domain-containing protein [Nitrosopumilus sp.]